MPMSMDCWIYLNALVIVSTGILLLVCRTHCGIIINEVCTNNPGLNTQEFIELFNPDTMPVILNDYTVVLYNGNENQAYAIIALQYGTIGPRSYYVIGSSNINPPPDRLIHDGNIHILPNGPNAVALYYGNKVTFELNMQVTHDTLIDALVYGIDDHHNDELIRILAPGELAVEKDGQQSTSDEESMSRCNGMVPFMLSQWRVTPATPGRTNNCTNMFPIYSSPLPPNDVQPYTNSNLFPFVLINEFDVGAQYVELYDGGIGGVSLDGLTLVFYSGETSAAYTNPVNLYGHKTDDSGYFLLAPRNFHPTPDIALSSTIANSGINAITLCFGHANDIVHGSLVTSQNLADVVIYGSGPDPEDNYLVTVLSPGHLPLLEENDNDMSHQMQSLSRCRGWHRYMPQSFRTTSPSPKADNVCDLPDIVINEVNVAAGNALNEFIEIYDGGVGHQSLDGLIVVLYNGRTSVVYKSYDLTGFTTNDRGFAVIGCANYTGIDIPVLVDPRRGFIQNGLDAVALHLGGLPRYRQGTPVSTHNLVDAVVYGTNDDPDLAFLHSLLPFQDIPNELDGYGDVDHSISRCACCQPRQSLSFGVGPVSLGTLNVNCVRNNQTVTETLVYYQNIVRINEIHMTASTARGEYIELYDSGLGGVSLDNIVVVVYNGNGDGRSSLILSLNGYRTNDQGLFLIGTSAVVPTPHLIVDGATFFPEGSGAVVLHKILTEEDHLTFSAGMPATRSGLIDVVVYGGSHEFDLQLVEILVPGQSQINTDSLTEDNAIIRCFSHEASDQLAFTVGQSSPSAENMCPLPSVVISEVNVVAMGEDIGEFVELSSRGVANFPLNNLNLVFWRGSTATSYRVIRIDGYKTDANGFFLIGYQGLISPRPDMAPFRFIKNYIKDASNVISLHVGPSGLFVKTMEVTDEGLLDAVAHRNPYPGTRGYNSLVIDTLTPGVEPAMEPFATSSSNRDESINRCEASSGAVSWQAAHISPKAMNHCPTRPNAKLLINEVSLVSSAQYIELWDNGAGFTSLDDFVIILYGEDNLLYWTIPLTDFMTDAMGYFVMGVASTVPHAQYIFAEGFLRTKYGAIALYRTALGKIFPESGPATVDGLIDAVVYCDREEDTHNELSNILTPASTPIKSSLLQISDASLSRCLSDNLRTVSAFSVTLATPKTMNNCPVFADDIFINEINVEQPGDRSKEFIELSDGGRGNTFLKYLSLVLFNGHNDDKSYSTFDLDSYSTNDNGFLLIGSERVRSGGADISISVNQAGLLQNGPDAIALYRAPSGAFPYGTVATANSLIDAIVYSAGDGMSHSLVDKLLPGRSMVLEDSSHLSGDESISRCLGNDRLDPLMYTLSRPSPGRRNYCRTSSNRPEHLQTLYINEISVDGQGRDFIELLDRQAVNRQLDGLIVVFFNGDNQDRSYLAVDLNGARTDSKGFLVIGNKDVSPEPDIIISDNIHQGPDAVVLYYSEASAFPPGTIVTTINIMDALVYSSMSDGLSLLQTLAPGQAIAEVTSGMTLSRCTPEQAVTMSAFGASLPTPGAPNDCSKVPVIINEIDLGQASATGQLRGQFIELYDGGRGQTPLTDYFLVLFTEADGNAYNVVSLTAYHTNSNGFFIVGNPNSAATLEAHLALPPGFIRSGTGAIVLYRSRATTVDSYIRMLPTRSNLVDVVVYGPSTAAAEMLTASLLPGQRQVNTDSGLTPCCIWTISRCKCCQTQNTSFFGIGVPTPLRSNNCSLFRSDSPVIPPIVINEINLLNRASNTEYIELKGTVNMPLDKYILVLFTERGLASYTVSLSDKQTDSNGIIIIGSHGMTPMPTVSFASSDIPIIHQGFGAVALYHGTISDFPVGSHLTNNGLVDAVVYTNDLIKLDNELTKVLTPESSSFYAGNIELKKDDQSISRCQCCQIQNNSAFTLSMPTPILPNLCPSELYSTTIQMRLLNAVYDIWVENLGLVYHLKRALVAGVNQYCQCGFNINNLKDDKILNGSVVYQATMLALDTEQLQNLVNSYKQYIQVTSTVEVQGTIYAIDSLCVSNCVEEGLPSQKHARSKKGFSPAVDEAIAVLCVIFLSAVGVCLFLLIKYRHQMWTYLKRYHNACEDGNLTVVFRRSKRDQEQGLTPRNGKQMDSFSNPLYMYEGASGSSFPTVVAKEPSQEPEKKTPKNNHVKPKSMLKTAGTNKNTADKGSVDNPLYRLGSNPIQTEFTTSTKQENGIFGDDTKLTAHVDRVKKKKPLEDGVFERKTDTKQKISKTRKKDKKPKVPDNFSNPLYGMHSGPAQLAVTTSHQKEGTVSEGTGRFDITADELGKQNTKLQNPDCRDGNDSVQSLKRKEVGIKSTILQRLKRVQHGNNEKMETSNQEPSKYVHM